MNTGLAILTLDFLPDNGGVQQYLFETAQRLSGRFDVTVITPIEGLLPKPVKFERVILHSTTPIEIYSVLNEVNPSHVLVGHAHPRLLAAAALFSSNYTCIAHGNDFLAAQHRWHRLFFNMLLRRSRNIITHSSAIGQRLITLRFPAPVVIHPGVDEERFSPGKRVRGKSPVLLSVCRLVPRKGIDTVLTALPQLMERIPELTYQVAGTGEDLGRLRQLSTDLGISNAVHFLGAVEDEALPDLYRNADIFVLPVREEPASGSIEGFGIVYLEAGASGLPVVAGRSGGAPEAVVDGETGLLVNPDDPEALATVLLHLLQDGALRKQLGTAARRRIESKLTWEQTALQIAEVLA